MKLETFAETIANELNSSLIGGKYIFKPQPGGLENLRNELWVGKWGKHGIKFTEFKIIITRNHPEKQNAM